ncbi:sulfotransferase-like domain-containing protein [Streptomyces fagopyri]|uniref:sulfotransferase-like domain-containing protein n=1 Tax=Streptomyces fagopyri TaxID=2662397 RepID=UPI00381A947E
MSHPLIFLWAHSRSRSTAFFRMMLERGDFVGVHEPFSSIVAQGYADVGGEKATTGAEVLDLLQTMAQSTPVFVKEVTEYRYDVLDDPRLPQLGTHTFLVRHPEPTIASHHFMNPEVTCGEIGYEHEYETFELIRQRTRRTPVLIEAEDLVASPETVVEDYCRRTGIPYDPAALSWSEGEQNEWERTAKWHQDVVRSTGFSTRSNTYAADMHNHPRLAEYYAHHLPFYERLRTTSPLDA